MNFFCYFVSNSIFTSNKKFSEDIKQMYSQKINNTNKFDTNKKANKIRKKN